MNLRKNCILLFRPVENRLSMIFVTSFSLRQWVSYFFKWIFKVRLYSGAVMEESWQVSPPASVQSHSDWLSAVESCQLRRAALKPLMYTPFGKGVSPASTYIEMGHRRTWMVSMATSWYPCSGLGPFGPIQFTRSLRRSNKMKQWMSWRSRLRIIANVFCCVPIVWKRLTIN